MIVTDQTVSHQVEFLDEEGTGLGPTLEFFALVAAELQRKDLCMWVCQDDDEDITTDLEQEEDEDGRQVGSGDAADDGRKPPGYYVRRESGLFPAPLAQNSELCTRYVVFMSKFFLLKLLQEPVL